jgi:hypothetical protein
MANTLQEQMLADAQSGGAFFPGGGSGFDVTLTHYPAGDLSAGQSVVGVLDQDLEDAGGVGDGEGLQFDTKRSSKLRRNGILSLPISVTVTETSGTGTDKPSLFDIGGFRYRAVRIVGRDLALQDVMVTRVQKLVTRGPSRH